MRCFCSLSVFGSFLQKISLWRRTNPAAPVQAPQRGFAGRFSAPLCKVRTAPTEDGSRLPCARGAGFSACLQAEKTEGLYPLTGYSVYTFHSLPRSFATKRKAVFILFAVLGGDFLIVYPFSFVTKRKVVKRQKKSFTTPTLTLPRETPPWKGGINSPPDTGCFLISTPSPTGSLTAYFQYNYFARLS